MKLPHRWNDTTLDVATALTAVVLGMWWVFIRADLGIFDDPLWIPLAVQVVGAAALLARRRSPGVVLAVCLAASVVFPVVATPVAIYAASRYLPSVRAAVVWLAIAVVAILPVWWATTRDYGYSALALLILVAVVSWILGRAQRASHDAAALRIQTERDERERMAENVRESVRSGISREMHDVVAHRISLIVLQANLLETQTDDPMVREALNQMRLVGRAALDEMREVLGLLQRRDLADDDVAHQSLRDVEHLVREARAVGQPVSVHVDVEPQADPGLAERTAFRIIREALTNAVRHAPGAATNVSVTEESGDLRVVVKNDAPTTIPSGLTTGGNGLRGLSERVALIGGSITAQAAPRGGFFVDARLPRRDT